MERAISLSFFKAENKVILLDQMARAYGQRPSDIIGITGEIARFDFDSAVFVMSGIIQKDGPKETSESELERLKSQFNALGAGEH